MANKLQFAIAIILIAFSLSTIEEEIETESGGLFDKKQMDAICALKDPDYNFTEGYSSLDSYVDSFSTKFGQGKIAIMGIFLQDVFVDLKELLKEMVSSVITLSFAIIALITWMIFGCCKCFGCGMFNSQANYGKCGKCSLITSIVFLTLIAISAIFSLVSTTSLMTYFNGSSCYFLQFFYESRYGESNEDKWVGLNALAEIMNNTTELVNVIAKDEMIFESHQELTEQKKKYDQLIDISFAEYSKGLYDPSDSSKTFQTIYSREYSSSSKQQLYLGKINDEYVENIEKTYEMMNNIYITQTKIIAEKESIQDSIQSLISNINEFNVALDHISDELINKAIKIQHHVSSWLMTAFRIIYGVFIACSLISLVCLPIYALKQSKAIGITIHLLWNLLMLLSIVGFIIGSVLGVAAIVGVDVVPAISYTFSTSFLSSYSNPFSTSNNSAQYFSTCLNGNGDLASDLKLKSSNIKHVNAFYELSLQLNSSVKEEGFIKQSIILPQILQQLKAMESDYTKATDNSYGIQDINYLLHDLSIYTDKGLERFNKKGIYCDRNDRWIGLVESCPDDYTYKQPSTDKSKLINSKNCFRIQDWETKQVSKLYQECNDNIKKIIDEKFAALKAFNIEHTKRIREMINTTEAMIDVYQKLYFLNEREFERIKSLTNLVYDFYYPIIGNETIFDLFDCGGLKDNFVIFFDQLTNYLTEACTKVRTSCISCSLFGYIAIFFLINVAYHYRERGYGKNSVHELIRNEEVH